MNRTEHIIKYILKDLEKAEMEEFDKLLASDPGFLKEYNEILNIWHYIKKQLTIDDLPGNAEREELVAGIIAEMDVNKFRNQDSTKGSTEFKRRLSDAMSTDFKRSDSPIGSRKYFSGRLIIMVFAIAAIIIIFLIPNRNIYELTSEYYNPTSLEIINKEMHISRGNNFTALQLFKEGKFILAKKYFELDDFSDSKNPSAKLFYSISCYETGDIEKSIDLLKSLEESTNAELANTARWYLSLILIKEKRDVEAIEQLRTITNKKGEYLHKSKRLLRSFH